MQLEQQNADVATASDPGQDAAARRDMSAVEQKMVALYQTIISMVGGTAPKTVQIMSARAGEGSAPLVRALARTAAGKLGKSVLLIDANRPHTQHAVFGVKAERGWDEVLEANRPISEAVVRVGQTSLHLSVLSTDDSVPPAIVESPAFDVALDELAGAYDLVLIDAPPASEAAEGLTMSPKVSGTILVIEAGATRWQVTGNVQQRIANYGGRVLGAILNKRRNYIPSVIYDHL